MKNAEEAEELFKLTGGCMANISREQQQACFWRWVAKRNLLKNIRIYQHLVFMVFSFREAAPLPTYSHSITAVCNITHLVKTEPFCILEDWVSEGKLSWNMFGFTLTLFSSSSIELLVTTFTLSVNFNINIVYIKLSKVWTIFLLDKLMIFRPRISQFLRLAQTCQCTWKTSS